MNNENINNQEKNFIQKSMKTLISNESLEFRNSRTALKKKTKYFLFQIICCSELFAEKRASAAQFVAARERTLRASSISARSQHDRRSPATLTLIDCFGRDLLPRFSAAPALFPLKTKKKKPRKTPSQLIIGRDEENTAREIENWLRCFLFLFHFIFIFIQIYCRAIRPLHPDLSLFSTHQRACCCRFSFSFFLGFFFSSSPVSLPVAPICAISVPRTLADMPGACKYSSLTFAQRAERN